MSSSSTNGRWLWWAGGLALVAAGLAVAVWLRTPVETPPVDAPPPDPRLSYEGPFQNIHPSVGYVGDPACVSCHRDIGRTYSQHSMGKTLAPFTGPPASQPLDRDHNHPFSGMGLLLRIEKKGNDWMHVLIRQDTEGNEVGRYEHPVQYTVGSATHGSSYLSVRDGLVLQTPISWYSQKHIWDVSPGFTDQRVSGREVFPACLYCHSNRFTPEPDYLARYKEPIFQGHAIGCERCHGPGEKHAAAPGTGFDTTIVNPARLNWQLRENVCEQCHLQGEARVLRRGRELFDWRPGLPLEQFLAVAVQADPENRHANNHVEQMRQSACFMKSPDDAKLGCVSCHDPHVKPPPDQRVAHYRQGCMNCHEKKGCSQSLADRKKVSPADSCIDCHMPRFALSDIVHTSATDHMIPRKPRLAESISQRRAFPLRPFYADRPPASDADAERDLGIGIARRLRPGHPLLDSEGTRAITMLNEHLRRVPSDVEAREAVAEANRHLLLGVEAERQYDLVLSVRPRRESALLGAAQNAGVTGKRAKAIEYYHRLVELAPTRPLYRDAYARVLSESNRYAEAEVQTRESLKLDPTSVTVRVALFQFLIAQGKRDEAGEVLAVLRKLRPPNLRELEKMYAKR